VHPGSAGSPWEPAARAAGAGAGWDGSAWQVPRSSGITCGCAGFFQQVAEPADRAHAGAAALQLATQAMDRDVQPIVSQFLVPVAQRLDQLGTTGDPFGSQRERFEQPELACGQLQWSLVDPCPMTRQIQSQATDGQFGLALAADPPQQGAHAGLELGQRERL